MKISRPECKLTDFISSFLLNFFYFNYVFASYILLHLNHEEKELKVVKTHELNLRLKYSNINVTSISCKSTCIHLLSKRHSNAFNIDQR